VFTCMKVLLPFEIGHFFRADHHGIFSFGQRFDVQRPVGCFGRKFFLHDNFSLVVHHLYYEIFYGDLVGHKPDAFVADNDFYFRVVLPSVEVGGSDSLVKAEEEAEKGDQQ
jgi:hypothetical protein